FDDDIRNLTKDNMFKYTQGTPIDLVVGGPPCQGFSVFGKRRFINTQGYNHKEDDRNKLVYEFIRVVKELKPKYFFMENVKGFLSLDGGLFVEEVIQEFKSIGYDNINFKVFCAADYGVPQKRYRMLMVGNRIGQEIVFPEPTYSEKPSLLTKPYTTVGDAINDLISLSEE